jgi:hypothetical protein
MDTRHKRSAVSAILVGRDDDILEYRICSDGRFIPRYAGNATSHFPFHDQLHSWFANHRFANFKLQPEQVNPIMPPFISGQKENVIIKNTMVGCLSYRPYLYHVLRDFSPSCIFLSNGNDCEGGPRGFRVACAAPGPPLQKSICSHQNPLNIKATTEKNFFL